MASHICEIFYFKINYENLKKKEDIDVDAGIRDKWPVEIGFLASKLCVWISLLALVI